MRPEELQKHINRANKLYIEGASINEIKQILSEEKVYAFEISKILHKAKDKVRKEQIAKAFEMYRSGMGRNDIEEFLSKELKGKSLEFSKSILKNGVVEMTKKDLNKKLKTSRNFSKIINEYSNEYVISDEIELMILRYYEKKIEDRRNDKKKYLKIGLFIIGIGLFITLVSALAFEGRKVFVVFGIYIAGIVFIIKSASINAGKIPDYFLER